MTINVLKMTKRKKELFVPKSNIKKQYWDDIEFECPVRGRVRQKVLVTEYEAQGANHNINFAFSRSILAKITDNGDN